MIEWVITVLYTIFVCISAWAAWMYWHNRKTFEERTSLIDLRRHPIVANDRQAWKVLSQEYDVVSYDQHLRARMMFRDPIKLYGDATQMLWRQR